MKEESASLNSEDVFILVTPLTVIVWKGAHPPTHALCLLAVPVILFLFYCRSSAPTVQTPDRDSFSPSPHLSTGTGSLPSEAVVGDNLARILSADYNNIGE